MFGSGQLQFFSGGEASFYPLEISNSLSFDDSSSDHLSFTPSGDGDNLKKYTISLWFKRSNLSTAFPTLIGANKSSGRDDAIRFGQLSGEDEIYIFFDEATKALKTTRVFRDVSAWYHLVLKVDTTDSTDTERVKLYINGDIQTLTGTYPDINYEGGFNRAGEHTIGKRPQGNFYDGYIAEVNFIDGTALTPSSFGETKNDIWVPKRYTGAYGTNGFRLQFLQSGTGTGSSSTIGADTSGRNNHFTSSGHPDQTSDSPTNNHATLGAQRILTHALSDGNLKSTNSSGTHGGTTATFNYPTSGKWYHEVTIDATDSSGGNGVGIGNQIDRDVTDWGNFLNLVAYLSNGNKHIETGSASYGTGLNANNIVGVAFDADNQTLEFYLATSAGQTASSQGTIPTSEMDGQVDFNNLCPLVFGRDTTQTFNFGQSAFNGTDGSGTLPTGFSALNTANLSAPTFDPNQDETPDQYFNTVLWTGNETARSITGVGFSPNWVWIKNADFAKWHHVFDTVRGTGKAIYPNEPNQEATGLTDHLTSFDSDGFSLGDHVNVNKTGDVNVAWNWKAGTSFSFSGETDTLDSSGSTSQEAGFSIVSYTGGSAERVKHNLGAVPEMIMVKDRDAGNSWAVYHKDLSTDFFLELSFNYAQAKGSFPRFTPSNSSISSSSLPTSTYFFVRANRTANISGNAMIAYCFRSLDGYSKMGSYVGNNSTDNTFVYTGFRPAFLMIKNRDAVGNWGIWDTERNPSNVAFNILRADIPDDEGHTQPNNNIDILSNGFKVRGNTGVSGDAVTYIYMAFAEQPFKYANAR